MRVTRTVIVVPCYNEADRLDLDGFSGLLKVASIHLLFVDDGSSDGTAAALTAFAASKPDRISFLPLDSNRGKAEAVRLGILNALTDGPRFVGFMDADLATPIEEIIRLASTLEKGGADAVIGSRIAFLGADIERSTGRHFLGRVFASAASLALRVPVYDTQCGAKFFRNTVVLQRALQEAFYSRWAFDVELLGRLLVENAIIIEVPLMRWVDVPGSKVGLRSMIRTGFELARIGRRLSRQRRESALLI